MKTLFCRLKEAMHSARDFLQHSRLWRTLGIVASVCFVPFLYFWTEMFNYRNLREFGRFLREHPKSTVFGLIIVGTLFTLFLFLCRKVWVSALICGTLLQVCGIIHYFKVALNGDPFSPMDFLMTSKMGDLLSFVSIGLPWWAILSLILVVLYITLLWLWNVSLPKRKPLFWVRLAGAVVLVVSFLTFIRRDWAETTFGWFGMTRMDTALQSSNYAANGLVGGFTLNLTLLSVEKPENYDAPTIEALLENYKPTPATQQPDVIVILCESYWDVRALPDTTFSADPMYFYDELCQRDNAYSGVMYTTALGGGTVRPEFSVLTGLSTDYLPSGASPYNYTDHPFPNHVSHFKEQGYRTLALHPYDPKFYNRQEGYENVGFDAFYGEQDIIDLLGEENIKRERGYVSDDSFVDAVIKTLEDGKGQNSFIFGISMENHQSFDPMESYEITVESPHLEGDLLATVNTYAQGVYHSTKALEKLVSYVDSREKETVLVFFGDHLPTLGANFAAYKATGLFDGINADTETRKIMFSSPFVIYGNYPLSKGVLQKTGNELSDYQLLSIAAALSGTERSAFDNWLLAQRETVPYYNSRLKLKKKGDVGKFYKNHHLLTYDRLIGKQYSK